MQSSSRAGSRAQSLAWGGRGTDSASHLRQGLQASVLCQMHLRVGWFLCFHQACAFLPLEARTRPTLAYNRNPTTRPSRTIHVALRPLSTPSLVRVHVRILSIQATMLYMHYTLYRDLGIGLCLVATAWRLLSRAVVEVPPSAASRLIALQAKAPAARSMPTGQPGGSA